MHSGEAMAGARRAGIRLNGFFRSYSQSHGHHLLLFSSLSSFSRLHIQISRQLCICKSQSSEIIASLSPLIKDEPKTDRDDSKPLFCTNNKMTLKERGDARIIELDKNGNHLPQISYLLALGMDISLIQRISRKFPQFTYYNADRKIKPLVNFLLDLGVPESKIPKTIYSMPQLCGLSLTGNIIPTMKYLETLGVDKTQWAKILIRSPHLLACSSKKMKHFVEFMCELGVPEKNIGKILTRNPRILQSSVDGKLKPVTKYFDSLGIDSASLIQKCPNIFGLSIEDNLKPFAEFFIDKGFSIEEFSLMINRFPPLYTLSLKENMVTKWEYFLVMGYEREELLKLPNYFGYNLEKRIKPRFEKMSETGVRLPLYYITVSTEEKFEQVLKRRLARSISV